MENDVVPGASLQDVKDELRQRLSLLSRVDEDPQTVASNAAANATKTDAGQKIHALIFGIDKYTAIPPLQGAVGDARRMMDFIVSQFGASEDASNITFIKDEEATYERMVSSIRDLAREDNGIAKDDPIVIFYAGHGGTLPVPEGWSTNDNEIQCLIPVDAGVDKNNNLVNVILDRTFSTFLHQLADAKGDNITVILDCCHSGSATRASTERARGFNFKVADKWPTISRTYENDILNSPSNSRGTAIKSKFLHAGLRSHVLLAACGAHELAYENNGEGAFTSALIRLLKTVGTESITYEDLIERIHDLPRQTPQCEGANKSRKLFDAKVAQRGRSVFDVVKKASAFTLRAGEIHGITAKTEFAVYSSEFFTASDIPLGFLVVAKVNAFTCTMELRAGQPDFAIEPGAVALQTRAGITEKFLVHVADDLDCVLDALAREIRDPTPERWQIALAPPDIAELSVVADESSVAFHHRHPDVRRLGLERLLYSVPQDPEHVQRALRGAAHFFGHLRNSPRKGLLRNRVDVRLYELEESDEADPEADDLSFILQPKRRIGEEGSSVITVRAPMSNSDDEVPSYGIELVNKSKVDLYAWVFYFDMSTLEIRSYFEPRAARVDATIDPPLRGDGTPTPLNFGSGGGDVLEFQLYDGQKLDVGFLRIVLSTQYLDLSNIVQRSPLLPGSRGTVPDRHRRVPPVWDAITLAVVQLDS